jgi:hypothetical protein
MSTARGWQAIPELNVAIFALLLNLPWEFWQVPLFREMSTQEHWEGVKACTFAAGGDAGIEVAAYWAGAFAARDRRWILAPRTGIVAIFIAFGLAATLVFEWLATEVFHRWAYGGRMPLIPLIGIGIMPALQWLVIPLLCVWFVRRQLT